jgi:hypothetical protein
MRGVAVALGVAMITSVAGAACDRSPFADEPREPSIPERTPTPAPAPGGGNAGIETDGAPMVERADPPGLAGDLRADVERFGSLDTCVAQHAAVDPVVGDAVRAIGYDTLLRDACRMLQAISLKDRAPCEAIAASGLQHRCEAMLAMSMQDADKCPWAAAADKRMGRDATCLAVAAHDPRMCAAELSALQPTCEAFTTGDPTRCSTGDGDRRTCERDLERVKSLLVDRERQAHDTTLPRAHFEIHGANDAGSGDIDLSSLVAGGAVVSSLPAGGVGIDLSRDTEAVLRLPSRTEKAHLSASIEIDAGNAKITKLEVIAPKMAPISCPSVHCDVKVTIAKLEPTRGSPVTASFEGTVETPGQTYRIHLVISSFVRDVVGRAALYGTR